MASGLGVIVNSNGQLGTVQSSARFKDDIKPMDKATEAMLKLRPVTFHYKEELDPDKVPQFGLIAEDVEKIDPDLVVRGEDGKGTKAKAVGKCSERDSRPRRRRQPGFFGGNYIYWAVELLPDSDGNSNRTISLVDPMKTCTFTCMGKPEQSLTGGKWVGSVPTNGDIFVSADAPLDHWVLANTGLKVGDIIPGLIGVEYNGIDPNVETPIGLQILLHSQAPRFDIGLVRGNGGFPLPGNFNGDFNAWYEDAAAVAAANAGRYGLDQQYCQVKGVDTTNPCSGDTDCRPPDCGGSTNPDCKPEDYKCLYPCHKDPIPPLGIVPPDGFCSNPWPVLLAFGGPADWSMTIYQSITGSWVFNAGTNQWSWGLDDYFTGLQTPDGASNGPALRTQCGYPFFHPGLVSCRNPAIEQITRNVLNKFINP